MNDCICFVILTLLIMGFTLNIQDIQKQNQLYKQYKIYTIQNLNDIARENEINTVNNIASIITYDILSLAKTSHTIYEWKDTSNQLNDQMYDKLFDKIITKFPDIKMEEFDRYTMKFDWS